MNKVFFARAKLKSNEKSLLEKTKDLFEEAGFSKFIKKDELVALKLHFGEIGNTAYIRPPYIRQVVEKIKEYKGKPFLTDANTLYAGGRSNAVDHLNTAIYQGFSYSVVQAPIIIADGLTGKDYVWVKIDKKHFKSVKISSAVYNASSVISLAHFKGHLGMGFGGAIKNLGMGFAPRSGKQMIHSAVKPKVDKNKCKGCGLCKRWCPTKAIKILENIAEIDKEICMGCGECTVTCPEKAISIRWDDSTRFVQERTIEYVYAILKDKKGKCGFMNFVFDVSPECDCMSANDLPIVPDVGILASLDPIAIDQASVDLVNEQLGDKRSKLSCNYESGEDKIKGLHPKIDWEIQLKYGEELNLGRRDYKLVEV